MKIFKILTLIICLFLSTLLYLHQKVQIYAETYKLSHNFQLHNSLLDEKDYLECSFANKISLVQVNKWAESNDLKPVEKSKLLALNLKQEGVPSQENRLVSIFGRFLGISTAASTALAEEKK